MNETGFNPVFSTMKPLIFSGLGMVALGLSACTPYQQQGAAVGGLAGAAAGAVFGDDRRDVARGAAAGAALGVGAAALREDRERRRRHYERYGIPPEPHDDDRRRDRGDRRPPPRDQGGSAPPPPRRDYPSAQRTSNPDEVLSPYPPHHRINVEGFSPGQLAKDPKTGKIFRVP